LRYFGGSERLLERVRASIEPIGHSLRIASAATAQGAAILAHLEPTPLCTTLEATRRALVAAPVWLLGPGRAHWEALQGMGLRRVGDLLGLPRAGLARRFGETLLAELDAAFGRRADPREPIVPARAFESRLELFARADSSEQVLHGASILLARLVAWLAAQHAFVQRFRLLMHHETRWQQGDRTPQATALEIALAEPSRDSAHLLVLLRERLAHVQLPAPTLELALQASDIVKRAAPNGELFPTRQSEDEGLVRLIERLQARLGAGGVQRLCAAEDHRPERASALRSDAVARPSRASRNAAADATAALPSALPCARPIWLQLPEPLAERDARPLLEGRALALLSGPERIESGWWDDDLAERDYFIAEASDGALVWIYRARLPLSSSGENGWFLHGRFG
jgi:protein ImuB